MRIKLMEPVTGPNGERFSDEAEVRHPRLGEWVMKSDWKAVMKADITDAFSIVLTPLPPATKVERIKVAKDYLYASDRALNIWPSRAEFRGAVYIHPASGAERVFGFTHPLFIRECSPAQEWDWSHARTKQHTTMIWPSFIEVER
jgi:hypothetical protein